jgi:hypothetical protein
MSSHALKHFPDIFETKQRIAADPNIGSEPMLWQEGTGVLFTVLPLRNKPNVDKILRFMDTIK